MLMLSALTLYQYYFNIFLLATLFLTEYSIVLKYLSKSHLKQIKLVRGEICLANFIHPVLQVLIKMSSLFFWFVYFALDHVYKVKAVFIVVLDRTTGRHTFWATYPNQFNLATKIILISLNTLNLLWPISAHIFIH